MVDYLGEPREAVAEQNAPLTEGGRMFQTYCNLNGTALSLKEILSNRLAGVEPEVDGKLTSARIKIFQRTETNSPRSFTNLQEVIDFLQTYTTVPVEVVSTTEKTSTQDQIRLFNSFDILVSVHGSHLSNAIYTMHPHKKAVIEIAPFMYDPVYFKNYVNDLNFAEYIVSTGHLTPRASQPLATANPMAAVNSTPFCAFTNFEDFFKRECSIQRKTNTPRVTQDWIMCPTRLIS